MNLTVYGENAAAALESAEKELHTLDEAVLSRTAEGSELYALNTSNGETVEYGADDILPALIETALTISDATDGAFDPTLAPVLDAWGFTKDERRVPSADELKELLSHTGCGKVALEKTADGWTVTLLDGAQLDLGGIAKGYASDRVAQVLRQYAVTGAAVSLGGNVYVCGQKSDGSAWSVAVQDPKDTGAYAMTLELTDVFAVTSGGYQRYFTDSDGTVYQHILDPRTGRPAQTDLLSVTVIGQNGTMADAYSTALYVMGEQAACDFWRHSGGAFDLVLITADGRVLYTPGLADFISQKGADYDFQEVSA